jgi:hypothetical protein
LLWLTGLIVPDHHSLGRFWNENKKALREVFQQTVILAVRTGAVGLALQALDGTKIQAAASSPQGWSKVYLEKLLAQLDAALQEIELKVVEENADTLAPGDRLPAGLAQRQALRAEIKKGLAQLQADGGHHYHPVEPEARRMKVGQTNRFAYNAQAVADSQEGIIVAGQATRQETDVGPLAPMIEQAARNLEGAGARTLTVADTGYGSGADLQAAADQQKDVLVPPAEGPATQGRPYATSQFHYDAAAHTLTCPQQRLLDHEGQSHQKGQIVQRFRCHHRDCPVRSLCTRDPKGRPIEVWAHTPLEQEMRARLQEPLARMLYQKRREIMERRFAQLKQHDGFRRWTVWGLEAVEAQWSFLCATLNLRILYKKWQTRGQRPKTGAQIAPIPGLWAMAA